MAFLELTTYISNCLLLRIRFDLDKKTIFDILLTLDLKYFLQNTFLLNAILSYRSLFIQIQFFRVMLTI